MVEFATKEIQMSFSKQIVLITLVSSLNAGCISSGGLRECGGSALLFGGIGAAIGAATGKNTKDRLTRAAVGGAIGGTLAGLTCLLNYKDRQFIEEVLNTAPPGQPQGACLGEGVRKTRGFAIKPDQCDEKKTLNVTAQQMIREGNTVCRVYTTEVSVGESKSDQAKACKGPDGKWKDVT
jgi:surface antigen